MRREKLYNLHTIADFVVANFVLKMDRILSNQILTMRKSFFSIQDECIFSYFIFLVPDMV
jgi:hypothetical protein